MRPHRVVVLDVLTKHPPQMPFVDGDDVIEALAPERPDHPLGDGVGVRRAHRSQNRLDPDPSSACDEVPAIATVAVSDEEPWLLTPGGRLDHLPPDPGRDRVLRDVPVPDAAPAVVDHDEHVERAEGEGLHREQVSSPDAGRVVAQKRAPRLTRRSPERLLTVAAYGASAHVEAKRTQLTNDADGAPPWMLSGDAQDQPLPLGGNVGTPRFRDDSSSASRRAKQNDATAQPCPARPSRACLASRTNRVPVVTRIGGRGDGAAVDDGPGCRRRADAAALSSRGRDLGGRGPQRRVLRQADGGRAQTSLSWLADTLLSQDRAAPIRFCRPTAPPVCGRAAPRLRARRACGRAARQAGRTRT